MFGFGKKAKGATAPEAKKQEQNNAKQPVAPPVAIPDGQFTVMPGQYLPQGKSAQKTGPKISKKLLLLGGGAIAILAIFGVALYVFFLSAPQDAAQNTAVSAPQQNSPETKADIVADDSGEDASGEISESVVRAQAYDESNVLAGGMSVTVPATVVQQYGSGIGVTVLDPGDLELPEKGTVLGGLYAAYPAGITFEEPLSVELSVANIPESYDSADIYPAYLRGVQWRELEDYQSGVSGFTFMMEKIPSGPLAVIWNPEEEAAQEAAPFTRAVPAVDTDGDSLTDAEEALFGTSAADPDTDGDTYLDWDEIKNGYSPLEAGAALSESGLFGTYTNTTYGYQISYPASWLASSLDQSNKQVLFVSDTEEFFEILIVENPLNTPIADWFRGQSPSLKNVELDVSVVNGVPAVWSPDGLTLYTSSDGLIYIITYNNGTRDEVSWPRVFEYFYTSFTFGATSAPQEGASDAETATTTEETIADGEA